MSRVEESFAGILNRLVDGVATEEDERRLAEWLRSGPAARKTYREFMALHSSLHWDYVAAVAPGPSAETAKPDRSHFPLLSRGVTFLAGVAIATAAIWTILKQGGETSGDAPAGTTRTEAAIASLMNQTGMEFAEGHGPDGTRFGPGEYDLAKGIVHLRFSNGADVILASPTRFEIRDAQNARLAYGRVRVIAPPTAKGFTIATRSADYIDLGTEFGLDVDRQTGASDLYVFDGLVNVADPRSGEVLLGVGEGESSRSIDGRLEPAPVIEGNVFPTSGSIGFQRWRQVEERIRTDPAILAFFSFQRTPDESVLVNGVDQAAVDAGRIVGARWASGRWPGKGALLFDRDSDYVELDIPGEYLELSIAAWIKVDRFDFVFNAILNSDGHDPGDIHFQMTRQGYPRGGVVAKDFEDRVFEHPVPLGEWVHVASVLDAQTRSQQIYVNGNLARERTWEGEERLRPGRCRLGNWLAADNGTPARRSLRGRVDELAIWDRVLSQDEVRQLVEAGRPGRLLPEVEHGHVSYAPPEVER